MKLVEFYHTFQIPEKGINFTGQWNHHPHEQMFRECMDVKGKSVFDVACRDGWYSLLFERMGASSVVACDIEDRDARRYVWKQVESKASFRHLNVYNLHKAGPKAQVVFCGDLLCHLYYPLLALEGMHACCEETCYFACDVWQCTCVATPDYPNVWSYDDMINLLKLAQFKEIKEKARFHLSSDYWKSKGCLESRDCVLFECKRNPDFVAPQLGALTRGSPNLIPELQVELPV